jgi:hypothetical protein
MTSIKSIYDIDRKVSKLPYIWERVYSLNSV